MLDRASLRALAEHPERNDPLLNVALAEEGDAPVLLALAECPAVGPETLARIAARIEAEGESVGHEPEPEPEDDVRRGSRRAEDEQKPITHGTDLDTRLIVHPRSDDVVRDAVLGRHPDDAFFVLAAAAHPRATPVALERAARWPASTPLHERPWLAFLHETTVPPLVLDLWAVDKDPLAREAAARLASEPEKLTRLAEDPSRRVRRAVATNPTTAAVALRTRLAETDSACEVRARAALPLEGRDDVTSERALDMGSERFRAAVEAMRSGGNLSSDVTRALRAGPLDAEGARLAARALDEAVLGTMLASQPLGDEIGLALAAGMAFRDRDLSVDSKAAADELVARCVRALAGADRSGGVVTGKARLATWLAEGVASAVLEAPDEVLDALGRASLAADRMVLGRVAVAAKGKRDDLVSMLAERAASRAAGAPIALIELAWRDARVPDETLVLLCSRVVPAPGFEGSPEQEVDLDPRARSLAVLERVGSALVGKAPLSPRAALALVALEPRRIRYVLSAMPQWRGVLAGANVARVLRAHAGALTAAGPSAMRRPASGGPAGWTQRRLDEVELSVALAIGDLAPADVTARLMAGQDALLSGTALAAGMEARAAFDGVLAMEPLMDLVARGRSQDAAVLATWLIAETLDRPRSAAAIAAALDSPWKGVDRSPTRAGASQPAARAMVFPGIAEALATLERRSPGRLADVTPQTARGRAALVSGIARAYRGLGGMNVAEG